MGPIEAIHRAILDCRRPLHVVVAAGANRAAQARLDEIPLPARHRRTVLGFSRRMPELMGAADLAVSKPGGLTTSESLASGTPLVIVNPIPGQESRNSDYLLEGGAAIKADSMVSLTFKVDALLGNSERLAGLQHAARRLGRPRAAFDVAAHALSLVVG